jgi:hypothetical protein
MPWVTIKTGIVATDGREAILTEYLCDFPGCAQVAEHVLGVARDPGVTCAACREHAGRMQRDADAGRGDDGAVRP